MKKLSTYLVLLVLLVFLVAVAFSYPTASADTKLKVTSTVTSNSVSLKWNKLSGAKYYKVYRKTAKTKYKVVCTKTTNKSFVNKNLKSGTKYTFKVTAFKKNTKGKFYGFKSATVTATPKFKLTTSATQNQATLKWNKADGAKYYKVYRKTASSNYKLVCKKTTNRNFVSKNLKANTKYTFKVKAYKKNKKGNYYAFKSVTGSIKTKTPTPTTTATPTTTVTTETTTVPTTTSQLQNLVVQEKQEIYNSFTNYEKLKLFERDLRYSIPTTAEVEELKVFHTLLTIEDTWGYAAKVKLDQATSEAFISQFGNLTGSELNEYAIGYFDNYKDQYSWWEASKETVIACEQTLRTGVLKDVPKGHTANIRTIYNRSYLCKSSDGNYYVYLRVALALDCDEYFASIADNTLPPLSTINDSLSTYIKNLTARQKAMLINKDFEYSLPEGTELVALEGKQYDTNCEEDNLNDAWGYRAKFKLTETGYDKLSELFFTNHSEAFIEPESLNIFSWWDIKNTNVTLSNRVTGKGQLILNSDGYMMTISTIWNYSWLTEDNGEYYLYIATPLSNLSCDWYEYKNTAPES